MARTYFLQSHEEVPKIIWIVLVDAQDLLYVLILPCVLLHLLLLQDGPAHGKDAAGSAKTVHAPPKCVSGKSAWTMQE